MSKPITVAVLVTGRTYPVRAALKKLGATWSPLGWLVPASRAAEAQALVAGGLSRASCWNWATEPVKTSQPGLLIWLHPSARASAD